MADRSQRPRGEEVPLVGGRVNEGVVRVGETARRPTGAHSPFVHNLLCHLEHVGFDGAPRFIGIDELGREIISFLPGLPVAGTSILTDGEIESGAILLRRYHDAAATLPADVLGRAETVVHGDPGPWNMLWLDGRATYLIDFDEARPGQRLEDLGYFAWKGLRLNAEGPSLAKQGRRLAVLAVAYGIPVDAALLDAIEGAVTWLHSKGRRERWSAEVLKGIDAERRWQSENRARLLGDR